MLTALGIDPGLRATGYSIIQGDRQGCRLAEAGVIRPGHAALPAQLREIYGELSTIVRECHPDVVVVEDLFTHPTFPRTALVMAHVRGAIYLAVSLTGTGVEVEAVPPAAVKRAMTGAGRAGKAQVQVMVQRVLGLASLPDGHAADAAALALTALSRRGVPLLDRSRPLAGSRG